MHAVADLTTHLRCLLCLHNSTVLCGSQERYARCCNRWGNTIRAPVKWKKEAYPPCFVNLHTIESIQSFCVLVFTLGEGHKEQLPMVLKVPRIIRSALLICQRDYSLLGYGDILVPGRITKLSLLQCNASFLGVFGMFGVLFLPSGLMSFLLCSGLFVSFCHSFDQMAKTPYRIYYVASSIGMLPYSFSYKKCNSWKMLYIDLCFVKVWGYIWWYSVV